MEKKRKRIAIITPTLNGGGAERVASNLSIELSPLYDVSVIVFDNTQQRYPIAGELIDLHLPSKEGFINKVVTLIKRIRKVKGIKKNCGFDCSISLMSGPSYVNTCSSVRDKTIVSVRNNMTLSNISKFEKRMMIQSCKKADAVVALSETVRNDLIDNFGISGRTIRTIYNSVDGERLLQLSKATNDLNELDGADYIVTVGRITKQKGQWHLIRAFSSVSKKYPELKLVILGQGEENYMSRLKTLVSNLGLEGRVLFLGYIQNPHSIIAGSILFVFSSLFEGLGNSILEALACQKAVISTDCLSGPREILAPGSDYGISGTTNLEKVEYAEYGVLTPAFSQDEDIESLSISKEEAFLSEAIESLLSDESLRHDYENKAKQRIGFFSPKEINAKWVSLINELLEPKTD